MSIGFDEELFGYRSGGVLASFGKFERISLALKRIKS
jgi:hypothetical protein